MESSGKKSKFQLRETIPDSFIHVDKVSKAAYYENWMEAGVWSAVKIRKINERKLKDRGRKKWVQRSQLNLRRVTLDMMNIHPYPKAILNANWSDGFVL
ncbi:hypothetical protein NPIL_478101 [Nephila pilipes]|uniref:Uncharacterized protein n=1 Tax=Nephila pilipes TaxID=299642 RepID=A0A8X6U8L3_NEPPI|nr:hypothetical protein NPIL_478101 [Nephila pilipes]